MPIMDDTKKADTKKAEWLEARKQYITGTEAAAILGISKWSTQLSVWLDKKGLAEPSAENEAMFWGKKLEKSILERYAEVQQCKLELVDGYELQTSQDYPRLACSLDGWNHNLQCPVDAKNIRQSSSDWGDPGTDQVPDYYKTQLAVQMAITGATEAHLAVLFSGQEFKIYVIKRDENLIQEIVKAADDFWKMVENDVMPQPDGSDADTDFLKKKFAVGDADKTKEANDEMLAHAQSYKLISNQIKELEVKQAEHSNALKFYMQDASAIDGICTWKNAKDSVKTDWESVAKEFASQPNFQEFVNAHTIVRAGNRTLRISTKI